MDGKEGGELVPVGSGMAAESVGDEVSDVQKIVQMLGLSSEEVSTRPLSWVYEGLVLLAASKKANSGLSIPEGTRHE